MTNLVALLLVALGAESGAGNAPTPFHTWWIDSMQQAMVGDTAPRLPLPGELHAARGEFEAIQVAVRSSTARRVNVVAEPFDAELPVRVRTVGRVPITRGTHHTSKEEQCSA